MKIALASPPFPRSCSDALMHARELIKEAAEQKAVVVCFPESYIPGYPLQGYDVAERSPEKLKSALETVCVLAAENAIAVIMPMDWYHEGALVNIAHVISSTGEVLGYQTKNQLDPSEDDMWIPGTQRQLFEVEGLKFGITICHEGFRYPESVRWSAVRGATVVFHPHFTGSDEAGVQLTEWGGPDNAYYEKATMMRAMENTIFFASVGYAMRYQESSTSVISPDGTCMAYQPYGRAGVLVVDIDPKQATGLLAKRFKPIL